MRGDVPGRHGRRDRERRAADHPYASGVLGAEPAVGGQRLPDHLWRVPAAGRPGRGPAGAAAAADRRDRAVRGLLASLRAGRQPGAAGRRPARPGLRGGDDVAGRAVHRDHHLSGLRPAQGAGRMGRDQRAGLGDRAVLRRAAHPGIRLAVGVLREPPAMRAGAVRGVPDPDGRPRPDRAGRFRRGRRGAGHRQHAAADLHASESAGRGLGYGPHHRRAGRLGGADGGVRGQ